MFYGFFNWEQCNIWFLVIIYSFVLGFGILMLIDNYIKFVVFEVECLFWALYFVVNDGNGFVFYNFLCFFQWEFFMGDYVFFYVIKIQFCYVILLFFKFFEMYCMMQGR